MSKKIKEEKQYEPTSRGTEFADWLRPSMDKLKTTHDENMAKAKEEAEKIVNKK